MAARTVTIDPHHPDCRSSETRLDDPERCCYCAAKIRDEPRPLDYRYGGPGCFCGPAVDPEEGD